MSMSTSPKKILTLMMALLLLAVPFLVWWKAQAITDWWQLHGYTPPASVATLASQDTMTTYAKHVFYVNHPDIVSSASKFRSDCQETEKTIILGCYHSNQNGIFIYDVTDSRLAGVEQVTAAHEMLHAAYDRLSSSDKNYVDGLLQDYYNNDLHDQRILDTINSYKQTEPNDVVNEMHSVFGTEIGSLPSALQTYYKRYFTNRSAIVDYADSYQGEFTSREDQIKADAAQLTQQKTAIDSLQSSLEAQKSQIDSDRARLDSLKSSGQYAAYNAQVDSYNSEIYTYNNGVDELRTKISTYNQLVNQYNTLAGDLASLQKSIDTRPVPAAQ